MTSSWIQSGPKSKVFIRGRKGENRGTQWEGYKKVEAETGIKKPKPRNTKNFLWPQAVMQWACNGFFTEPQEGINPADILISELTSRTEREYIPVVLRHQVCDNSVQGNPRKLIWDYSL